MSFDSTSDATTNSTKKKEKKTAKIRGDQINEVNLDANIRREEKKQQSEGKKIVFEEGNVS